MLGLLKASVLFGTLAYKKDSPRRREYGLNSRDPFEFRSMGFTVRTAASMFFLSSPNSFPFVQPCLVR